MNTHGRLRHGDSRPGRHAPEFNAWVAMRQRCNNVNGPDFAAYGGRGIRVCPEWDAPAGYEAFLAHVGRRPSDQHTLDRIDNDRGYEPGNVRWATRAEQSANRRSCRLITLDGRTQTIAAWSREIGIDESRIRLRLRRGWDTARALSAADGRRRS